MWMSSKTFTLDNLELVSNDENFLKKVIMKRGFTDMISKAKENLRSVKLMLIAFSDYGGLLDLIKVRLSISNTMS